MSREIRITIDDDEVFERMKARKTDLDLSWRDVLRRGLRAPESGSSPRPPGESDGESTFRWNPEEAVESFAESRGRDESGGRAPDPDPVGDVAGEFKRAIRDHLRHSFRESIEEMEADRGDLEREVGALEEAEDAVLRFDVLENRREYGVPLRVNLEASRGGLDAEVVAVRQGKAVEGANRFDREARRRVNEHLARGGAATLTFEAGESYAVAPVLSWRRDGDGATVDTVEIEEVLFDDES